MTQEQVRQDLWKQVYVASIRSGQGIDRAKWNADAAVKEFNIAFGTYQGNI